MNRSRLLCLFTIIAVSLAIRTVGASPASPNMLDSNNCHTCMKACDKFGLKRGTEHCHIFPPYAFEDYKNTYNPNKARFGEIFRTSMDRISLTADKGALMICPLEKSVAGGYEVTGEGCGIGGGAVTLKAGVARGTSKIFNASLPADGAGLYNLTVDGKDYQAMGVCNNRIIVVNKKSDVICAGNFVKDKLYIFCKGLIDEETGDKTDNYCKATLTKSN